MTQVRRFSVRWVSAMLGAALLGAGATWFAVHSHVKGERASATVPARAGDARPDGLERVVAELPARVARLEQERDRILSLVRHLEQLEQNQSELVIEVRALAHQQIEFARTTHGPVYDAGHDVAGMHQTVDVPPADVAEYLENTLSLEPDDPSWTREVEHSTARVLAGLQLPDAVLDAVRCRQSACRIEILHPEGRGDATVVESLQAQEGFQGDFFARTATDSRGRRTFYYLARSGESLFPIDEP